MRTSLLLALLALTPLTSADGRPNLLLILTDDMGYGDIGCYGSRQIQTPAIDALARSGIRMTQGYAVSSVCAPSRAGLMSGRYPNRFGFEHNLSYPDHLDRERVGLPLEESTVAEYLHEAGYATALVGKWHLGEYAADMRPNARGFEHFFGMRNGSHGYFPTPEKHHLWRNAERVTEIAEPYLTDWFTSDALAFLERTGERPWFLYLSLNTPHTPLQAPEEDLAAFAHVEGKKRRTYCAMQRNLDRNVGRVMDWLEQSGQRENTLVVFLSDNGGACNVNASINAPLNGQKGLFLEGGMRVPWIVSWPGQLPENATYDPPVIALDLLPTFLAAADIERPAADQEKRPLDGVDLLPFWRGERSADRPHDVLYWRIAGRVAAIRKGDWKVYRTPFQPAQLFDLARDAGEDQDLASEHPERVRQLLGQLNDWECSFDSSPLWVSGNMWAGYNRKLHDRQYVRTQPE